MTRKDKKFFYRFLKEHRCYNAWMKNVAWTEKIYRYREHYPSYEVYMHHIPIYDVVRNCFLFSCAKEGRTFWLDIADKYEFECMQYVNSKKSKTY